MKNRLQYFIDNPEVVTAALDMTKNKYRSHDPGWYLYRQVCKEKDFSKRFADEFIELAYVTLHAWGMNDRAAQLADWEHFTSSIRDFRGHFKALSSYRLHETNEADLNGSFQKYVWDMFSKMELVAPGKPRLVTYSKAFHFYLPDLFVPIDRKYTLNYFYGHTNLPRDLRRQFEVLSDLHCEFSKFAPNVDFITTHDEIWNANIPKVIDNIIIGYQKIIIGQQKGRKVRKR